jgi:hypothetical protein
MAVSRPVQAPQPAARWAGAQRPQFSPQGSRPVVQQPRVVQQRGVQPGVVEQRSFAPQRGSVVEQRGGVIEQRSFGQQRGGVIEQRGGVIEQRGFAQDRGGFDRGVAVRRGSFGRPVVIIPRFLISAPFNRPFYSFRPRFNLGFGLFVGYPVAFPSWYDYPFSYDYGYGAGYNSGYNSGYGSGYNSGYSYSAPVQVNGYPADSGSVSVDPGAAAAYGGVSLDITPTGAAVFVDGVYVGIVNDFSPTKAPLTIAVGDHHIELRAQGYQSMAFDLTVTSRQIVPYQGTMQVIRD